MFDGTIESRKDQPKFNWRALFINPLWWCNHRNRQLVDCYVSLSTKIIFTYPYIQQKKFSGNGRTQISRFLFIPRPRPPSQFSSETEWLTTSDSRERGIFPDWNFRTGGPANVLTASLRDITERGNLYVTSTELFGPLNPKPPAF